MGKKYVRLCWCVEGIDLCMYVHMLDFTGTCVHMYIHMYTCTYVHVGVLK